jgi:membrane-bound lytic murein transglycosylase A
MSGLLRTAAIAVWALAGTFPATADDNVAMKFPDAALEPLAWSDLDAWATDDHAAAFATFMASCKPILAQNGRSLRRGPLPAALQAVCRSAVAAKPADADQARAFFEENFQPIRIARLGESAGFLTGYYEPIVEGARAPSSDYAVPMFRRPADLVMLGNRRRPGFISRIRKALLTNKGKVVRQFGRRPRPYYDRAQIENGALDGRRLEICWVKDPVEAFFIQIQGSARVRLADGSYLRLNYDGHNGHAYTPVGRVMIERGLGTRDTMSMARIRDFMAANPDQGRELRHQNKSFVFFRVAQLSDDQEAVGGQGIPLTAGRSIAVDRALHLYGMPFWIEAELGLTRMEPVSHFRRLMVAQDTGGAIIGPARADIYFGAGDEAGRVAGNIRNPGRFVMLVPRHFDPLAAWRNVPMPPVKAPPDTKVPPAPDSATSGSKVSDAGADPSVRAAAPALKPKHPRRRRYR